MFDENNKAGLTLLSSFCSLLAYLVVHVILLFYYIVSHIAFAWVGVWSMEYGAGVQKEQPDDFIVPGWKCHDCSHEGGSYRGEMSSGS